MTELFTDIETIPAQRPDVLEEIRASKQADLTMALASIAPPGNYKKQETIDEWLATDAPKIRAKLESQFDADVDEAYRKTGLDGSFGQVCVIGAAVGNGEPIMACELDWQNPAAERKVLESFSGILSNLIDRREHLSTCVVGHNVSAFDLRFIAQRSIVLGVKPHVVIARAAQAKPWEGEKVFDTMVQWAGVGRTISLDRLCKALKLPGKGDMDGSKVWDRVKAGGITDVATYCAEDVRKVRAVYQRMTFQAVVDFAVQPELQAA